MTIEVTALIVRDTAAAWFARGVQLASALGVEVTSWRVGDPTRSCYKFLAEMVAGDDEDPEDSGGLEGVAVEFIRAGFLRFARGLWLTIVASDLYGVERVEATYATAAQGITLQNTGGGFYPRAAGDLTIKSSITGKTYHSTSEGVLSAGATVAFDFVADEPGSDSTLATDDLDTLVTTLRGVVVVSSLPAIGLDEQSDDSLKDQCRASKGALSPNGPRDAYEYVVRNPDLTGVTDIARARAIDDSDTGDVTVYVAGVTGPVAGASLTAAQNAIAIWAEPLCITPTVAHAVAVTINVTAALSGSSVPTDFATRAASALLRVLTVQRIAGTGGGVVDTTLLTQAIRDEIPELSLITMSAPAAPVALALGQYPVLGVATITQV